MSGKKKVVKSFEAEDNPEFEGYKEGCPYIPWSKENYEDVKEYNEKHWKEGINVRIPKREDNLEEVKIVKRPTEDSKEWVIRQTTGRRVRKDGTVVEYTYNRRYPKKASETRGRKREPNKLKLRGTIKNLTDEQCKNILDYIDTLNEEEAV